VLRAAVGKLSDAGWVIKDGAMMNAAGEPFAFTLTIANGDQQKIALHFARTLEQIGIKVDVRLIDPAQFAAIQKTYDYDMIPATWFNSLRPAMSRSSISAQTARPRKAHATIPALPIRKWMPPSRPC
jgi:peptide/nickel transport system substrate-binding protein